MKKLGVLLLIVLISLSACTSGSTTSSDSQEKEANTTTQQQKEQDIQTDSQNNDQKEKNEKENDEEVVKEEKVEPKYTINQSNWLVEPINESVNEKVVLLTIDDAPDKYALEMAKTLKELKAGAIFFVNGHFLDTPKEKETLRQIHDMGFMIGNHTYSHAFLPDLSKEEQKEEIVKLNKLIEEIIDEKPLFFRAPNGANTEYTKQTVEQEGMVLMNWSYGYDYFEPYMNAEKLTKAMVTGKAPEIDITYSLLNPGANLLMHDREWTAQALNDIVIGLREQGYEIVDPHLIKTK